MQPDRTRPMLSLVPDEPLDSAGDADDAAYREAMRLIVEGYTQALKLIPPSHPDYPAIQRAARAVRESAGLAPLQSAQDAPPSSASG